MSRRATPPLVGTAALLYFANCAFCQAAWLTLLISLAAGCGWQAIPNALGYAAVVALILERGMLVQSGTDRHHPDMAR